MIPTPARSAVSNAVALAFATAIALCCSLFAPTAHAQQPGREHVYVVAHGDTVSTIAQHLGVTTRALIDRNHLHAPYPLRTGRRLRLPDGVPADVARHLPYRDEDGDGASTGSGSSESSNGRHGASSSSSSEGEDSPSGGRHGRSAGGNYGRARHTGIVRLVREFNGDEMTINLRRVSPSARRRMEHFLRFPDGRHHPINPELMRRIAIVSDHFGGRRLHVVSGFRPWRRGQWTAHSNHNVGAAMDFRVEGVPNRVLRDFCTTIPHTGCGFYPRSVFVHMDARRESAVWVDWSRPGQRPMYGSMARPPADGEGGHGRGHGRGHGGTQTAAAAAANGAEDESVDDVAADSTTVRTAPPSSDDEGGGGGSGGGGSGAGGSDSNGGGGGGGSDTPAGGGAGGGGSGGSSGASGAAASGN